jgi:hypothetical protein
VRNDPDNTRTGADPEDLIQEELDEAAELLPQQEPPAPDEPAPPTDLDPLLTDPAD